MAKISTYKAEIHFKLDEAREKTIEAPIVVHTDSLIEEVQFEAQDGLAVLEKAKEIKTYNDQRVEFARKMWENKRKFSPAVEATIPTTQKRITG